MKHSCGTNPHTDKDGSNIALPAKLPKFSTILLIFGIGLEIVVLLYANLLGLK